MNKAVMAVLLLITVGCVTVPPLIHEVPPGKTYDSEAVGIVASVNQFFNKENIPVKILDNVSGIIATEEIKVPYTGFQYLSDYCDCGFLGGLYVYHDMVGKFGVIVRQKDNSATAVDIKADFKASLWKYKKFIGWVECQSKGYIESKLIDHLNASFKQKKQE